MQFSRGSRNFAKDEVSTVFEVSAPRLKAGVQVWPVCLSCEGKTDMLGSESEDQEE